MDESSITTTELLTETHRLQEEEPLEALALQINLEHEQVLAAGTKVLDRALRVGELLLEAKQRVGHGDWSAWVREHCPSLSARSIRVYMQLARRRSHIEANWQHAAEELSIRAILGMMRRQVDPVELGAEERRERALLRKFRCQVRRSIRSLEAALGLAGGLHILVELVPKMERALDVLRQVNGTFRS